MPNSRWMVRATGDASELFGLLHQHNEAWWEDAVNGSQLTHDDDPDSDRMMSVTVSSLKELRELLSVMDQAKHVSGLTVFVTVEMAGVSSWASIGRDWLSPKDQTFAEIHVDEAHRNTRAHKAIKNAIDVLSEVDRA